MANLPAAGASISSRIQIGLRHRGDAARGGRRKVNCQKPWRCQPDPPNRGHRASLVLREGAALVGVGTVLGFSGAIGLAKIVSALANMFVDALKVGMNDPVLLVGAPLLLTAVAMLACYVPARRSVRIDPLEALRQE
jgi:FtsX-like permease family protein